MTEVHLSGHLICGTEEEARIVSFHLPTHVELTRAEVGCLAFDVTPTIDPLVWVVAERFEDQHVFELHQQRVAGSDWGRATVGITRRYSIVGLSH
ncbi:MULTISPECIES: putative quinol monooxygenase [unclassified Frigoribacterium]|uniref:putative quinol monooxygenase n=1 Tax=unclassified Frigoribacterium TaxID=2627005 RepID=UPI0006FDCA65|nr:MULTISPECIES: antibiotic biosynthesis monooxygenase [unclassified Frigoribacterium]KQM23419.1 antibiotic biosynthesis monooxygenase [Frigoribacterium sp. Leaf8]WAC51604.1 antibiotic biosynthesis monooxygenase [Frigoribacterium sp. SL97]